MPLDETISAGQSGHITDHDLIAKLLNGIVVNVKDPAYGAVGDGSTDDFAAVNAALDAIRALDTATTTTSKGAVLFFPAGTYRLSATLRINRGIVVQGVGGYWYGGTVLKPDAGVTCIQVDKSTTSTDGGAGDGSTICDLQIRPASKSGTAHGIFMKARAWVRNVYITGCSGNGVHIVANNTDVPATNANCWYLDTVISSNHTGHGVFADGSDANAGVAIHCSAKDNGGSGFYDSSDLGCHFVGCETSGNDAAAYKSDSTSTNAVFLGCYSESGQPANSIGAGAMWLGGVADNGFDTAGGLIVRGSTTGARFSVGALTNPVIETKVNSESRGRWLLRASGKQEWTDGSSATTRAIFEMILNGVLGTGATDCFRTGVVSTGSRPSAATVGKGSSIFDSTLNKPIWSNGTIWVDAAGSAV